MMHSIYSDFYEQSYILGRYYIKTQHNISCNGKSGKYVHEMKIQIEDEYDYDIKSIFDSSGKTSWSEVVRNLQCLAVHVISSSRLSPMSMLLIQLKYKGTASILPKSFYTIGKDTYKYEFDDFSSDAIDERHKI